MKDFFKDIDNYVFRAKKIFTVFMVLYSVLCGILAIVCFVAKNVWLGFLVIFLCVLIVIVAEVMFNLLLTHYIDVKLIRNKLYEENNDDLEKFIKND